MDLSKTDINNSLFLQGRDIVLRIIIEYRVASRDFFAP
jgi:hypothetical protein